MCDRKFMMQTTYKKYQVAIDEQHQKYLDAQKIAYQKDVEYSSEKQALKKLKDEQEEREKEFLRNKQKYSKDLDLL